MLFGLLLASTAFVRFPSNAVRPRVVQQRCTPLLQSREMLLSTELDDGKTEALYAWLCRAFTGDMRYNNLMMAFAAVFGDGEEPTLAELVELALAAMPSEHVATGERVSLREREQGSLGAMGAGQWTGQFRTRPHALLDVRNLTSVDEWVASLPRGARRTLAKANANAESAAFTVVTRPIMGDEPAPHSTLQHFKCLVEHEVRLLDDGSGQGFVDALAQAIGRYRNCISQAGEIREYRDADGRVIAFAQEATKGRVIRGQWYYATDAAASKYVWFHSVKELVRRAIADEGVDYADLGPSGTDAFSVLKAKYGFASVSDWHAVADYRGPFRYPFGPGESWAQLDPPDWLFDEGVFAQMRRRIG